MKFCPATARSQRLLIALATAVSIVSFVCLAWLVPLSNQAFRETAAGRPLEKTVSELSLIELASRLERTINVAPPRVGRSLWLDYHTRWALACAPLVMTVFSIAAYRRGTRRTSLVAVSAAVLYFAVFSAARSAALDGTLPAFAAAWTPNLFGPGRGDHHPGQAASPIGCSRAVTAAAPRMIV